MNRHALPTVLGERSEAAFLSRSATRRSVSVGGPGRKKTKRAPGPTLPRSPAEVNGKTGATALPGESLGPGAACPCTAVCHETERTAEAPGAAPPGASHLVRVQPAERRHEHGKLRIDAAVGRRHVGDEHQPPLEDGAGIKVQGVAADPAVTLR